MSDFEIKLLENLKEKALLSAKFGYWEDLDEAMRRIRIIESQHDETTN